jgi:hypothetical protein
MGSIFPSRLWTAFPFDRMTVDRAFNLSLLPDLIKMLMATRQEWLGWRQRVQDKLASLGSVLLPGGKWPCTGNGIYCSPSLCSLSSWDSPIFVCSQFSCFLLIIWAPSCHLLGINAFLGIRIEFWGKNETGKEKLIEEWEDRQIIAFQVEILCNFVGGCRRCIGIRSGPF